MLTPQVLADHEAVSHAAAHWITERLRHEPTALLCLAAGNTPLQTYELLAEKGASDPALFGRSRLIKLDEWGGLPTGNPASCEHYLRQTLIAPLALDARYVAFDSQPKHPAGECQRISIWLAANGPIDTCVLGLGLNGHLGFNEPASFLQPHAHVATLSQTSLTHATLGETSVSPTYGMTLGMTDLLQARNILLLVTGAAKQSALQQLLNGRVTTEFPASFLQLHNSVLLLCDEAAAGVTR